MYLVRIPHRKGHSIQRVVLVGLALSLAAGIHGHIRVDPNGRDLEWREATRIEQPLTNPAVWHLLVVAEVFDASFPSTPSLCDCPALGIRPSFRQHVPDNGG